MKYACRLGCDQSWLDPDNPYKLRHEVLPHVRCTCGRVFSERGRQAHFSQLERRGIYHSPDMYMPAPPRPDLIREVMAY